VPTNQHNDRGLLAGLFDINFTTFVTLRFLKAIYVLLLVLLFRIGENTSAIAAALTSTGGGYAGSYGAVPPPGQPHPPAGT